MTGSDTERSRRAAGGGGGGGPAANDEGKHGEDKDEDEDECERAGDCEQQEIPGRDSGSSRGSTEGTLGSSNAREGTDAGTVGEGGRRGTRHRCESRRRHGLLSRRAQQRTGGSGGGRTVSIMDLLARARTRVAACQEESSKTMDRVVTTKGGESGGGGGRSDDDEADDKNGASPKEVSGGLSGRSAAHGSSARFLPSVLSSRGALGAEKGGATRPIISNTRGRAGARHAYSLKNPSKRESILKLLGQAKTRMQLQKEVDLVHALKETESEEDSDSDGQEDEGIKSTSSRNVRVKRLWIGACLVVVTVGAVAGATAGIVVFFLI